MSDGIFTKLDVLPDGRLALQWNFWLDYGIRTRYCRVLCVSVTLWSVQFSENKHSENQIKIICLCSRLHVQQWQAADTYRVIFTEAADCTCSNDRLQIQTGSSLQRQHQTFSHLTATFICSAISFPSNRTFIREIPSGIFKSFQRITGQEFVGDDSSLRLWLLEYSYSCFNPIFAASNSSLQDFEMQSSCI